MIVTLGVDHGTQELRFCRLSGGKREFMSVPRRDAAKTSVLNLLEEKGFLPADLIGLTYSMGDGITSITDIRNVSNRGQLEEVTGESVGGGTRMFDEIQKSRYNAVLIPGLHRGIECLDERFRLLYSHMAASEKVALCYHASNVIEEKSFIVSDISSNTVSIAVKNNRFFGALDACLGAPGVLHGPLDLDHIRGIDTGRFTANKAFYSAGLSGLTGIDPSAILGSDGKTERTARKALIMAVLMEVYGMSSIVSPDAIVLAGSAGTHEKISHELKKVLRKIAPVHVLGHHAAAQGAAEIARDILRGKKDFLGIKAAL